MRESETGYVLPFYPLERCQKCGEMVEDRAWDGILMMWVGECCVELGEDGPDLPVNHSAKPDGEVGTG
jgi:hypothetical protein